MRGVRFDPKRIEIRMLLRHTPIAGGDMLEVGCGDGRLTRRIAAVAGRITGVDPDQERVTRAKRLTPSVLRSKVRFQRGSAERLPFRSNRFDLVLFSWSL